MEIAAEMKFSQWQTDSEEESQEDSEEESKEESQEESQTESKTTMICFDLKNMELNLEPSVLYTQYNGIRDVIESVALSPDGKRFVLHRHPNKEQTLFLDVVDIETRKLVCTIEMDDLEWYRHSKTLAWLAHIHLEREINTHIITIHCLLLTFTCYPASRSADGLTFTIDPADPYERFY
mgnify:CR=1 FL=1|tara:strand:+ start:567 stop:1103 length:537 start_codon:yes stop_codon:yes gene_type:complete